MVALTLRRLVAGMLLPILTSGIASAVTANHPVPRLEDGRLLVDGRPYLVLGGELANSSASDRAYMAARWSKLRAMHLNTVLMPVSWELIEPEEGRFDFALVDGLLADARAHGLHIVLLWFGSWKNSRSSYVPGWVKRDQRRFPRARTSDGAALEMLSPFVPANADADADAFAALMTHLSRSDPRRTVIMVQVENEVGMIPEARDHSAAALAAWRAPVPAELYGAGQSWAATYGDSAEESFMAWWFARYVERVAAAGKRAYALPMYVNAALPRPSAVAGSGYPAAGPLPQLAPIWRAAAPAIDFLAPDIYFPNFTDWAGAYGKLGAPLFIPEAGHAGASEAPANALFVIGELGAIGFSPFAIDEIDPTGAADLDQLYTMLGSIDSLILARRGHDQLAGVRPPVSFGGEADLTAQTRLLAGQRLTVQFIDPWAPRDKQTPATHGAIIAALGKDELIIAGRGVTVTFAPAVSGGRSGIERIDEGGYVDDRWAPGRRLNGDESHQGRHVRLPPDRFSIQRVKLYHYE